MNRFRTRAFSFFFLSILAGIGFFSFSFSASKKQDTNILYPYFQEFQRSVDQLNQIAEDHKIALASLTDLKKTFLETRTAYKRIEFFVEYYYPTFTEDHINGAPLLHIERHDTRPFVVPPEGLQVLDEMIFADSLAIDKAEIANMCQRLLNQTAHLENGIRELKPEGHEIVEAARQNLIRVFTLGVTGFDTPGSLHALEDARTTFSVMQEIIEPYLIGADPESKTQIPLFLEDAQHFLAGSSSFEEFDRLTFLRSYINPLYKLLYSLKTQLHSGPIINRSSALNPEGTNLFADDFLNPYFFTILTKEEDSEELRALGQKLFYDPLLSRDNKMSCASCHNPSLAFTDGRVKSSSNVMGQTVLRNAPTLMNAVYADRFFYDARAFTLEQQVEHVVFNDQEFNTAYEEIVNKLNSHKEYRIHFKKALGASKITRDDFSRAMASFVLSLRSFNSPFDLFVRGETDTLSPQVSEGFNLFMGKAACGTCHFAPTFSGLVPPRYLKNESEILGVLANPQAWKKELDADMGRYANEIYSEQAWIFERSFKTTTVRNVQLTAPYFHNGAYPSLEAVVNFYDLGGGAGFGLEVKNQTLPGEPLHLTIQEKEALIAFMNSLTDNSPSQR